MSADVYLQNILDREAVDTGPSSPARAAAQQLAPVIQQWAGRFLVGIQASGSFAKGTANRSGTDIDLFISLSDQTPYTLKEIYEDLFKTMQGSGYAPKRQNVSINVRVSVNGLYYDVDLVPARRQDSYSSDHSLYRRRADTWTKTNVDMHIKHVSGAGRQSEIRIIKLWRNQKNLDFPSFYLELTAINALSDRYWGGLSSNVLAVFEYLENSFPSARVQDPANTNNIVSEDLTAAEKAKVKAAAKAARIAQTWGEVVK